VPLSHHHPAEVGQGRNNLNQCKYHERHVDHFGKLSHCYAEVDFYGEDHIDEHGKQSQAVQHLTDPPPSWLNNFPVKVVFMAPYTRLPPLTLLPQADMGVRLLAVPVWGQMGHHQKDKSKN